MQIEKRLEKLKKSRTKDSQSKAKVQYQILVMQIVIQTCWLHSLAVFLLTQEEAERSALEVIQKALMDGKPARSVPLTEFEKDSIRQLCLLTMKPVIYVANVTESDLSEPSSNPHVREVMSLASELQSGMVTVSAQVLNFCFAK